MILTIDLTQTKSEDPEARQGAVKNLKILWATHHFLHVSPMAVDIAEAVNVSPQKIHKWSKTPEWRQALQYWTGFDECHKQVDSSETVYDQMQKQSKDFRRTESFWCQMVLRMDHLFPPEVFDYLGLNMESDED